MGSVKIQSENFHFFLVLMFSMLYEWILYAQPKLNSSGKDKREIQSL